MLVITASMLMSGATVVGQCSGPIFMPSLNFPAGMEPRSVTTGDFNGDGVNDLATANSVSDDVSVLLGKGDGTFGTANNFAAGDSPRSVQAADFDEDGVTDLVTANLNSDDVSVLLGKGDGTFATEQRFMAGDGPISVTTGDFNGDGVTDLATANPLSEDVSVLLGNGNGTFAAEQRFAVQVRPVSITTGDFNGDGATDLGATGTQRLSSPSGVSVMLGNGKGTFADPVFNETSPQNIPTSITTSDFNGDGTTDLAVAHAGPDLGPDGVRVLLGNGDGTFATGLFFDVTKPRGITNGDFDDDGFTDLATANPSNTVSVLPGNGDGTFATGKSFPTGDGPWSVTTGDFNGDGFIDLATANHFSDDVSVLLNDCDDQILLGDVNLDGVVDLLDVAPFVKLLISGDFQAEADINGDGVVNLLDIQPFVDLLIG